MYLDDHHTADEINAGMAGGLGFDSTFGSFEETEEMTWTSCAVSSGVKRSSAGRRDCAGRCSRTAIRRRSLQVCGSMRSPSSEAMEKYQPQGGARAGHLGGCSVRG